MKTESTYYISVGLESKYYTLWYCDDLGKNFYIKNLSINKSEALAKAKLYVNGPNLDEDIREEVTNKINATVEDNSVFDGSTLCYGQKYLGDKISEILKDDFGFEYLEQGYGYPSNPTNAQKDCFNHIIQLPEIVKHRRMKKLEADDNFAKDVKAFDKLLDSNRIGIDGDKVTTDVNVQDFFWFDGMYGESCCVKLVTKDNNLIIVFTSAKWVHNIEKGQNITIAGTIKKINHIAACNYDSTLYYRVKSHYDFDDGVGFEQTQLTRVKIIK